MKFKRSLNYTLSCSMRTVISLQNCTANTYVSCKGQFSICNASLANLAAKHLTSKDLLNYYNGHVTLINHSLLRNKSCKKRFTQKRKSMHKSRVVASVVL